MGLSSVVLLTLVACGGKTTGVVVTGDDPAAMRLAPAGASILVFMDLETIRPDALPASIVLPPQGEAMGLVLPATVPGCVTSSLAANVVTYTFTNCKAANTGTLTGTVTVTVGGSGSATTYTELFNLTATVDATKKWHYTGTQVVTVTGSTATASVSAQNPILAAYTDTTVPANNKTYAFSGALTMNWATANRLAVGGGYSLTRTGVETIAVTIAPADPLVWTTGCDYPGSGTLTLALTGANGSASTTAVFGPTCGQMTIGGGALALGGH